MTAQEKLAAIDANVDKVYAAGYRDGEKNNDLYDKGYTEALGQFGVPNEVTGTSLVTCDYVNENEHNVEVKLSSDTVTAFSGVEVVVRKNNLFDISKFVSSNSFINNGDGTITCKGYAPNTSANKISECCPTIKVGQTISITGSNVTNVYFGGSVKTVNSNNSSFVVTQSMLDDDRFGFYGKSSTTTDNYLILSDIMINEGEEALPYEPYFEKTYTANADGILTIPSISPVMNIICDGVDISAKYYCCPTFEYDRYWDSFQEYGEKTDYSMAFANKSWNDDIFKPKYQIKPTILGQAFSYSSISEVTEEQLNTDNTTNIANAFRYSKIKKVCTLNLQKTTNIQEICSNCNMLEEISFKNYKKETTSNSSFNNCKNLKRMYFYDSVIGKSLNLQWSSLLEVESAKNIIQRLANYSGTANAFVNTLTFSSDTWDLLDAEGAASPNGNTWREYIESLGWLTM